MKEPRHVGTWVFAATPQGDIIKWGKDGDTVFPYSPDDKEAVEQVKFLTESKLHKKDRLYIAHVFNNGQIKHFEWDRSYE
jgi:hypothetical protein